jgi:hypothetical protein
VLMVAWLLGRIAANLGYLSRGPTFAELCNNEVENLHVLEETFRGQDRQLRRRLTDEEKLCWHVMAHADSRGSDVRLAAGMLTKPDRAARQSSNPAWWVWRTKFSWSWRRPDDHINEKELRASFTAVRRRARVRRHIGTRFLLLTDSSVALAVMAKHRSSSHKLLRVCRRLNALEMASFMRPVYAFVRSSLNPADRPSRVIKHGKRKKDPGR